MSNLPPPPPVSSSILPLLSPALKKCFCYRRVAFNLSPFFNFFWCHSPLISMTPDKLFTFIISVILPSKLVSLRKRNSNPVKIKIENCFFIWISLPHSQRKIFISPQKLKYYQVRLVKRNLEKRSLEVFLYTNSKC